MSAARNLTDADVEAIADALERRFRVFRNRREKPLPSVNVSEQRRREIHDQTMQKLARPTRKRGTKTS